MNLVVDLSSYTCQTTYMKMKFLSNSTYHCFQKPVYLQCYCTVNLTKTQSRQHVHLANNFSKVLRNSYRCFVKSVYRRRQGTANISFCSSWVVQESDFKRYTTLIPKVNFLQMFVAVPVPHMYTLCVQTWIWKMKRKQVGARITKTSSRSPGFMQSRWKFLQYTYCIPYLLRPSFNKVYLILSFWTWFKTWIRVPTVHSWPRCPKIQLQWLCCQVWCQVLKGTFCFALHHPFISPSGITMK